jgi:Dolichyl-phosphate-mannose-protein mannosyltransferase
MQLQTDSPKPVRWQRWIWVLPVTTVLLFQLITIREKSPSYDEVTHLPAGYSYLSTREIRLNPQHPPLVKEICAIPLLFFPMKPDLLRELQSHEDNAKGYEWTFGRKFLFSQNADFILFLGRIPVLLFSVGLAALLMFWAGDLWGSRAGLIALVWYLFDPTVMAHSQFITTDLGCAFFSTLFLYCLRRYFQKRETNWLVFSGISLGLALGAKFSAVILIPITLVLSLLKVWHHRTRKPSVSADEEDHGTGVSNGPEKITTRYSKNSRILVQILQALGTCLVILGLASLVLWVIYFCPSDPLFYVKGIRRVNQDRQTNYLFYLLGQWRENRWLSYFLIAWLVKTPLPFLILFSFAVVLFVRRRVADWLDELFLALPAVGYFLGYTFWADNLGVRYLIPCFPFLFIFAARIASQSLLDSRSILVGMAVLLSWQAFEFVAIAPDHLSYFNQIAGGSRNGYKWLDDSNVDWGQGIIQLVRYLNQHTPLTPYHIYYFGTADLAYYGIEATHIGDPSTLLQPSRGTLIISAHWLARLRAGLAQLYGSGRENWLLHARPKEIIGHAYYVYEVR